MQATQMHPDTDAAEGHTMLRAGAAAALLASSSIELTTNGREAIRQGADFLPQGTAVYLPKMPRETLENKLEQVGMLREFGLEPVPHIVARQLCSARELEHFLRQASADGQLRRALIIGGDDSSPAGPFRDSASVLASGIMEDCGLTSVDVAGYPDGHPRIPEKVLDADLQLKRELTARAGLRLGIVTQFSFAPDRIIDYCETLARRVPEAALQVGMAGPTSTTRLLRYARICGVSTSLRAVNAMGIHAVKLAAHSGPGRQVEVVADAAGRGRAGTLTGFHLFSFGGFVESARWLHLSAQRET